MTNKLLLDFDKMLFFSSVHIYWLDCNNVYQGCNDAYAKAVGLLSPKDIIGKTNLELPVAIKDPVSATNWDKVNLETINSGKQRILEEQATLMDGTMATFISHKVPIKDDNGKISGMLGISTNITKQKLEEHNLRKAKEKAEFTLEYIVGHLPEHIYWKDEEGIYLGSNDQQARSLGLQCANEVIGKTDFELPWEKEKAQIFRKNDLEVMRTGIAKMTEEPSLVNGKQATVLSRKVPLKTKDGEIVGVMGISIDITDRKNAEKLQIEKHFAEKISEAMTVISGCIAHEIRTPLSSININSDSLQLEFKNLFSHLPDPTTQKEQIQKLIDNIKAAVKRGDSIVNMLLVKLHSIFSTSNERVVFKPYSMKECVEEALKEYPFYKDEKGLITKGDLKASDFIHTGNFLLTKHILFNLIKNSLKAIKEAGEGEIWINLLSTDDKFNYLIFKDTATGISPKRVPTLFEQFNNGSPGNSGLGLPFCKIVMQSYEGNITCLSKEGEFTEFRLSFPRDPQKHAS